MPTYDYRCGSCGHEFDKILSIARMQEPESEACPDCGATEVKQFIAGWSKNCFVTSEQLGRKKAPEDFRHFMNTIKKKNRGSTMPDY